MSTSEHGEDPTYVNNAHRAALMYSFARGLLAGFIYFGVFSTSTNLIALFSILVFFASAVIRYIQLGMTGETDNEYRDEGVKLTVGMWLHMLGKLVASSLFSWASCSDWAVGSVRNPRLKPDPDVPWGNSYAGLFTKI